MSWLRRLLGLAGPSPALAMQDRAQAPLPARRYPLTPEPLFDLAGASQLVRLFALPAERRDAGWHEQFWCAMWSAAICMRTPPAITGPDGFPYCALNLLPPDGPAGEVMEANSLANIARSLVAQGLGFALFPSADGDAPPLWVAPMGVIDALLTYDCPDGDPADLAEAGAPVDPAVATVDGPRITLTAGQEVLIGAPSATYLSPDAARALHRHLTEGWGLSDPRVALIVTPRLRPSRSLLIGRRVSDFTRAGIDETLMHEQVRMLGWYLPPGRPVMLLPETMPLGDDLVPLTTLF